MLTFVFSLKLIYYHLCIWIRLESTENYQFSSKLRCSNKYATTLEQDTRSVCVSAYDTFVIAASIKETITSTGDRREGCERYSERSRTSKQIALVYWKINQIYNGRNGVLK